MFRKQIDSAVIRACADDMGVAIRRLEHLLLFYKIFDDFKKVSGLTLKPAKCVAVMTV